MAPRSRTQFSQPKALQRRDALIERLVDLIQARGFANASVDELARELRCSKSTLYAIADTKERIILTGVRRFFARSTALVEQQLAASPAAPLDRIRAYLLAISDALTPAAPAFFADLDAWESTRAIYRDNTHAAAARVKQLVDEAMPNRPDAIFIGAVAGQIMESIHRGNIEQASGLDDAAAYRYLADLIVRGLNSDSEQSSDTPPPRSSTNSEGEL